MTVQLVHPLDLDDGPWERHARWLANPANTQYLEVRWGQEQTPAMCRAWCRDNEHAYYIWSDEDGFYVGTIKAMVDHHNKYAEVAYMVAWTYRGRGYGTAALEAMLGILRDLGIVYVQAGTHKSNSASRALLRKLDFTIVGEHPNKLVGPSGRESHILYGREI